MLFPDDCKFCRFSCRVFLPTPKYYRDLFLIKPVEKPVAVIFYVQSQRNLQESWVYSPFAMTVSPMMTSESVISSVNTGAAAAWTSVAVWAAKAASSA